MKTWLVKIHIKMDDWIVFCNTEDSNEYWVLNQGEYRRVLPTGNSNYFKELGYHDAYHPKDLNIKDLYPEEFL